MTDKDRELFVTVMVEKAKLFGSMIDDPVERFRRQVELVVVDTELLVSGDVILERWLEP